MRQVASHIEEVVKELYGQQVSVVLSRPAAQFGDYATNVALQLAKQLSKSPQEVATAIVEKLSGEIVDKAEVAGPGFINLHILPTVVQKQLLADIASSPRQTYGSSEVGAGQTVICEFPSPNMAKPFSVGHIRAGLQGWAIAKLMELMGYKVITDNHVGDSGTPFGKWVVGFLHFSSDEKLNKDGINELSRVYIQMTHDMKTEKEAGQSTLADEVQTWLQKLERKDAEAVAFSERFNQISFDHMHEIMQRLSISTEFELGESQFVSRGQQMVDELLGRGVAEESDGAVIVRLDESSIDTPIMLRKANGTALYATTDLATIEYRQQNWQPIKSFIHTGQEQAFYFRQLNALAKRAGFEPVIEHLWHGLVDIKNEAGEREKMSSRKGVVLLQEFLDYAEEKAKSYAKEGSDEDIRKIALAAVKFNDFTADRKNGVLFDWENMFSVQGFSGPAVQYAGVRISSILNKAGDYDESDTTYSWETERELLLQLIGYPALLGELHTSFEMHKLATYLYTLAREFNRYYEQVQILNAEPPARSARLWLLAQVYMVLESGLGILGIELPDRM